MLPTRFWDKVKPEGECLVWTGNRDGDGYGRFRLGKMQSAHRLAYEDAVGPIPDGLQLDHLCRNTPCVNPAHLEPVTYRVNQLRGIGFCAVNAQKIECVNGHPFDEANTYIRPGQRRACRACGREATRRYLARRKAA